MMGRTPTIPTTAAGDAEVARLSAMKKAERGGRVY